VSARRRLARIAMYGGIVVVVLGMSKVHAAYVSNPPYDFTGSFRFAWSIAFIGILAVAAYGLGLPDLPRSTREALVAAVGGSLLGAGCISVLQLVMGDALLPRFVVASVALLLIPWYLACVAMASAGVEAAVEGDRVLVVASSEEAEEIHADLVQNPERPAHFVGSITPSVAGTLPSSQTGHDADAPLCSFAEDLAATVVVLSRAAQGDENVLAQASQLHAGGVRIRTVSLFYEEWLGKLPLSELEQISLMFDIGEIHRMRYTRAKRVLDLALGLVGLLGLAVLIPVVAILNLVMNRGPLFYRQPRIGKNGITFDILKFRTMQTHPDTNQEGVGEWTSLDDPRVTSFGRVLRTTHLDELPQVWNILRGDLSVVGPRPEQPRYVEELSKSIPFYDMRHMIRPGLTGWAQVKYGYAGDASDAVEKLQYEFYYLRRQSIGLDLRIVGRTVRAVLGHDGR